MDGAHESTGATRAALSLWLAPGLGPVRIAALLERFGSAEAVLSASPSALTSVPGIGAKVAESAVRAFKTVADRVEEELLDLERIGGRALVRGTPGYPEMLAALSDAPPVLLVRGNPEALTARPSVAMVGSRRASAYGIEQAEKFAGALARAGLTITSGGARGIDAAAHRGTLRAGGTTVVVLGSGLLQPYPPEHAALYDDIAEAGGAIVSELPCRTAPAAEQFPRRNRIISGLSLGVLVVEAGRKSGALITARQAAEEHGREVMALPGRVDSETCRGSLELLRDGATLIIEPGDVLRALEHPAWFAHHGKHADRYAEGALFGGKGSESPTTIEPAPGPPSGARSRPAEPVATAPVPTGNAGTVFSALDGAMTLDELSARCGLEPSVVRAQLTILELGGLVARDGTRIRRRH